MLRRWRLPVPTRRRTPPTPPPAPPCPQEWSYFRGGLSTIDRDYGIFNKIHHDIGTHVVHHLFPQVGGRARGVAARGVYPCRLCSCLRCRTHTRARRMRVHVQACDVLCRTGRLFQQQQHLLACPLMPCRASWVQIPHYNLEKATEAVKPVMGEFYRECRRGVGCCWCWWGVSAQHAVAGVHVGVWDSHACAAARVQVACICLTPFPAPHPPSTLQASPSRPPASSPPTCLSRCAAPSRGTTSWTTTVTSSFTRSVVVPPLQYHFGAFVGLPGVTGLWLAGGHAWHLPLLLLLRDGVRPPALPASS